MIYASHRKQSPIPYNFNFLSLNFSHIFSKIFFQPRFPYNSVFSTISSTDRFERSESHRTHFHGKRERQWHALKHSPFYFLVHVFLRHSNNVSPFSAKLISVSSKGISLLQEMDLRWFLLRSVYGHAYNMAQSSLLLSSFSFSFSSFSFSFSLFSRKNHRHFLQLRFSFQSLNSFLLYLVRVAIRVNEFILYVYIYVCRYVYLFVTRSIFCKIQPIQLCKCLRQGSSYPDVIPLNVHDLCPRSSPARTCTNIHVCRASLGNYSRQQHLIVKSFPPSSVK